MPLVTRIRHLGAFALVEANDRLFIDGQAHTPNNLAPIAFDKLGALSAVSTQERTFWNDPLFSLPRSSLVWTGGNVLFDTTILSCGKNVGNCGIRYDAVNERYFVGAKRTQNAVGTVWDLKVYDKNFEYIYGAGLPAVQADTSGASVYLLNSSNESVQFAITQQLFYNTTAGAGAIQMSRLVGFDGSLANSPSSLGTCSGWFQAVHQAPGGNGRWTLVVRSELELGTQVNTTTYSNFNNALLLNNSTGATTVLGSTVTGIGATINTTTPHAASDSFGCLASNAEYVLPEGTGDDDVFFYTIQTTTGRTRINVCNMTGMSTSAPTMVVTPCEITMATTFATDTASNTRRFKPFVFRDSTSGTAYLGVASYEPYGSGTMTYIAHNIYLFRISGDSRDKLTYVQRVRIGDFGAVRNCMPMDTSMKKWLVCYNDKFSIYQWNPTTNFSLQSTQNVQPSWISVDNLGRLWMAESESLGGIFGDGQKLYYFPSSGTAVSLTASFQQSSYTFSGSALNSNIVVNAYDLTGARTAIDVLVSLEGSNVTFADGSVNKTLTTSTTGDTLVPIVVKSTGLLRATIMEAV